MAAKSAKSAKPVTRLTAQDKASQKAMDARYGVKGKSAIASKGGPGKRAK